MNKLKFKALLLTTSAFAGISISALANDTAATLDFGPKDSNFYCNVVTPDKAVDVWNKFKGATVNIDTQGVNIDGAKEGQYVSQPGHLTGVPISTLKDYYFKVSKDNEKGGKVTITPVGFSDSASLDCKADDTGGRQPYEGKAG